MSAAPPVRLRRLRRARWIGLGIALAGAAGAFALVRGSAPTSSVPRDAVVGQRPDPLPPRSSDATPEAAPGAPAPPSKPTRKVRVRVMGREGGVAGVSVRALENVPAESCFRSLSRPVVTDAEGHAVVRVPVPAPDTTVLELALGDETGFRHGFVPLVATDSPAGASVAVRLPEGGRLEVAIEGLPTEGLPRHVTIEFLSPYGDCNELFGDLDVRPSEDGGIFETKPSWRTMRLDLAQGRAHVAHVASDHAVSVVIPEPPAGFLVGGASATGPLVTGREADLLRVPEGANVTYTLRYRPAPTWSVRVRAPSGEPVADARVATGLRDADGTLRLLGHVERTDAEGRARVPLWTGARLPHWTPPALVALVWAPSRRARLVEATGTWDPPELDGVLDPGVDRRFTVEGRVFHADGRPGAGLPVRLAAAEPWNGHSALEGLATKADGEGRFVFTIAEDLRPALEPGKGLRVYLDADALEAFPDDAFWRQRWPYLPRAHLAPRSFPFPDEGGRARVEFRVQSP